MQPLLPRVPDAAQPCTANFSLPTRGDDFADVLFMEAQPPDAQAIIAEQSRLVRVWRALNPKAVIQMCWRMQTVNGGAAAARCTGDCC